MTLKSGSVNWILVMTCATDESSYVSELTVGSWMERLRELCKGYQLKDIWNMDKSGCFFKALPTKGFVWKGKKCKVEQKSNQRMTVAFFVSVDGGKVGKPIINWKSQKSRCFKRANAASKIGQVSYFTDAKYWIKTDFMEKMMQKPNSMMRLVNWDIFLFLENAPVDPESLVGKYSNITVAFLPKNNFKSAAIRCRHLSKLWGEVSKKVTMSSACKSFKRP